MARSRTIIRILRSSRICNPLVAEVLSGAYDFGVAFDGDADRIGVVDASGQISLGVIISSFSTPVTFLARTGKGQPIIFDVKCSQALARRDRESRRSTRDVEDRHSLIKGKDEGAARADRRRDVRPHVLQPSRFYGHDDAL
jgi:phosphomannomutase/phosphoglucomutase